MSNTLSIGEVAQRTGVSISALHFYERKGLIQSQRSNANHRLYPRSIIRRVTIIQVAQKVGMPLKEIAEALKALPNRKNISAQDWEKVSTGWRDDLDNRIDLLIGLRDQLNQCVGCGCLSLEECSLANKDDVLAEKGAGAHLLTNTA